MISPRSASLDPHASEEAVAAEEIRVATATGRRRVAIFGAALVIAAIGVALWKGPPAMLAHAGSVHSACLLEAQATASLACEGDFSKWLAVPLLWPPTRDEARTMERGYTADEIAARMTVATDLTLDRSEQCRAADELVVWMQQPDSAPESATRDGAFTILARARDRQALVKHAASANAYSHSVAMEAALGLGDVAATTELARVEGSREFEFDLHRGAWLCLADEREAGIAALEASRRKFDVTSAHVSVATVACNGTIDVVGASGFEAENTWATEVLVASEPARSFGLLRKLVENHPHPGNLRSMFFADWLASPIEREPADVVAFAPRVHGSLFAATTTVWLPGGNMRGGFDGVMADPVRHEAAAAKVDALLARIEAKEIRIDREPSAYVTSPLHVEEWVRRAEDMPAVLRDASSVLWLETAALHARVLDREGFVRALEHVPDDVLRGPVALVAASQAFRVGDRSRTRDLLRRALADAGGWWCVEARLFSALLDLGEGRAKEALAAARRAGALLQGASAGEGTFATALDSVQHQRAVGWVEAAAALAAGEESVETTVLVDERADDSVDWFTLARASDEERRRARFHMRHNHIGPAELAVLPAVVSVLREVARDGEDPEVWIDRMVPPTDSHRHAIGILRARIFEADMRADLEAAALWDARADALQALLDTPQRALLGRIAGID